MLIARFLHCLGDLSSLIVTGVVYLLHRLKPVITEASMDGQVANAAEQPAPAGNPVPIAAHLAELGPWELRTRARYPWLRWSRADAEINGAFGGEFASRDACFEELHDRLAALSELEMAIVYQLSSFMKHAINVGGGSSPKWGGWHRVRCARSVYRRSLEPAPPIYPGGGCLGYICETIDDYGAYSGFGGGADPGMVTQCLMLIGLIARYCELDEFFVPSAGPFDGSCLNLSVPDEEEFDPVHDAAHLTEEKVAERERLRGRLTDLVAAADVKLEVLIGTRAPEAFPIMCPVKISSQTPSDSASFGVQDELRCQPLHTVIQKADMNLIVAQGHPDPRAWFLSHGRDEAAITELWTFGLDALGDVARHAVENGVVHDITCPNQLFDRWLPAEMQGARRPAPIGESTSSGMQTFSHGGGGFTLRAAPNPSASESATSTRRFSAGMHAAQARAKEDEAARWEALRWPLCDYCGIYIAASERAIACRRALAMARHQRLGVESPAQVLSADLMQSIARFVDFGLVASIEAAPTTFANQHILGCFCSEEHCTLACDVLACV